MASRLRGAERRACRSEDRRSRPERRGIGL